MQTRKRTSAQTMTKRPNAQTHNRANAQTHKAQTRKHTIAQTLQHPTRKRINAQTFKHRSAQTCKRINTQTPNTQTHKRTNAQTHKHANTQTHKHPNTHAHPSHTHARMHARPYLQAVSAYSLSGRYQAGRDQSCGLRNISFLGDTKPVKVPSEVRVLGSRKIWEGVRERGFVAKSVCCTQRICRHHSLVDKETRSTFTCVLDSLPVLGSTSCDQQSCVKHVSLPKFLCLRPPLSEPTAWAFELVGQVRVSIF